MYCFDPQIGQDHDRFIDIWHLSTVVLESIRDMCARNLAYTGVISTYRSQVAVEKVFYIHLHTILINHFDTLDREPQHDDAKKIPRL